MRILRDNSIELLVRIITICVVLGCLPRGFAEESESTHHGEALNAVIDRFSPIFVEHINNRNNTKASAKVDQFVKYLYTDLFLYLHAQYSDQKWGYLVEDAMENYYGVYKGRLSEDTEKTIMIFTEIAPRASRAAERRVSMNPEMFNFTD